VALLDLNLKATEAALKVIKRKNPRAKLVAIECDVGDEGSVAKAFAAARKQLGAIDILVNNAGINTQSRVETMSIAMWDEMIRVDLRSMFLCSREVIAGMKKKKWGRIINFSSQLAHKGAVEMAHYCAAKAGVMGFTRSLAQELIDYGITVNSINPGPINTPILKGIPKAWLARKARELPAKRFGEVREVVPTIVMLASDEGSYYVGASMNMNGGDIMI